MNLRLIPGEYTICRLAPIAPVPQWAAQPSAFSATTRTGDELSIIMESRCVPPDVAGVGGWALFRVAGTLPMDAVGVVAAIARVLAEARISLCCIATHDTDYFLVRSAEIERAQTLLTQAGYGFI